MVKKTIKKHLFSALILAATGILILLNPLFSFKKLVSNVQAATISFVGSQSVNNGSGATTLTISTPIGTVNGNVLVAQVVVGGATTVITPPAGWTLIRRDNTGSAVGDALYYKVAGSAEPGSYTWTFNSSQKAAGGIAEYSGVNTASPVDVNSGHYSSPGATVITANSVTTVSGSDKLLFFGAVTTGTTVSSSTGMVQHWVTADSTSMTSTMSDQDLSATGATGNRTAALGTTTGANIGQLVALQPSGVVPSITPTITLTPTPTPIGVISPTPTLTPTPTPIGVISNTPTPTITPTPTTASTGDPVIAAAGDIACDPSNSGFNAGNGSSTYCREKYTANVLSSINPAAVLPLGDNQYYCGGLSAFQQSYDISWGQFKSVTHPAVGNHEYLTSGGTGCTSANTGAAGYYQYFGAAAGDPTKGYYSYDVGTWHLISLNTQCSTVGGCGSGSPQYTWLQNDLATHTNACTLAYYHIPLYSSGGRASSNSQPLFQLLYNYNADLVLAGHDHTYERFAPQDANGNLDTARGIREFVAGTGGANHTSFTTTAKNSEVRNATTFGILKLTLHPTSYDWQFVPEAGATFTDSGTTNCH